MARGRPERPSSCFFSFLLFSLTSWGFVHPIVTGDAADRPSFYSCSVALTAGQVVRSRGKHFREIKVHDTTAASSLGKLVLYDVRIGRILDFRSP